MEYFVKFNTDIDIVKRLDFNFWSPRKNITSTDGIEVKKLINWVGKKGLTTSAFYPSITPFYQKKDEADNLIPFIRVGDTRKFLLEYEDTVFLNKELLYELSKNIKIVHPGDIVITKGGEYIGEVSLVPNYYEEYAICRDILAIRLNNVPFSSGYLCSYLQSQHGKKELLRTRSVQGQPHLTLEKVYEINIPYLGNEFEEEINAYWDSFYALINDSNSHLIKAKSFLNEFLMNMLAVEEELYSFDKVLTLNNISQRIDVQ